MISGTLYAHFYFIVIPFDPNGTRLAFNFVVTRSLVKPYCLQSAHIQECLSGGAE